MTEEGGLYEKATQCEDGIGKDRMDPSLALGRADSRPAYLFPDSRLHVKELVLSIFLCEMFIGQFFEERQVLAHFSDRV